MLKDLKNLDRFYFIFAATLLGVSMLVIIALRSSFSALAVSREIDKNLLETLSPRIDVSILDQAYEQIVMRRFVPLDLK